MREIFHELPGYTSSEKISYIIQTLLFTASVNPILLGILQVNLRLEIGGKITRIILSFWSLKGYLLQIQHVVVASDDGLPYH